MDDWSFAKGIHELGIGFFAHLQLPFQDGSPSLLGTASEPTALEDTSQGGSAEPGTKKRARAQEAVVTARKSVQRVLDCQTIAVFTKGSADIYSHPDGLKAPPAQDVEAMISTASDESSARSARDFKSRLDAVTLAYESLIESIIKATESEGCELPQYALKDAAKIEAQANLLYSWASTFVPKDTSSQALLSRTERLNMVPYMVAMAYAVRAKLDAYYVESRGLRKADRAQYLQRSSNTVNEFTGLVRTAICTILEKSSLLEVAVDYHLTLTSYVALIVALEKSVQMTLSPGDSPGKIEMWDDGLSGIRAALCRESGKNVASASTSAISLDTLEEVLWWARFGDRDYKSLGSTNLRASVTLRELLLILGAAQEDASSGCSGGSGTLCLAPDSKNTLIQLPPVHSLRSALETKLAALGISPPVLESFARIREVRDLPPLLVDPPMPPPPPPPTSRFQLSRTLTGHKKWVWTVAVSADGEQVASGGWDNNARIWSLGTGQLLTTFTEHSKCVSCVAFCHDGKQVVSCGSDGTMRVWSTKTGSQNYGVRAHTNHVRSVVVSPDGQTVASASLDRSIKVWKTGCVQSQATLIGHISRVNALAFSPDGQMLASGSEDATIKLWDVRAARLERTITHGIGGGVRGVVFTPDGQHLVSGDCNNSVKVWNWRTGAEHREFKGHTGWVNSVAVFSDGRRIVSGSRDTTIKIWDSTSGTLECTLTGHTKPVLSVAVAHSGKTLVSSSADKTVRIWELN